MRKVVLVLLGLVAAVGFVWAGGGTETARADEAITLEIWSWAKPEMQTIVDAIQPEFPNVTYEINVFPYGEVFTRLQTALRARSGPDIYYLPHNEVDNFWNDGLAVDMEEYGFSPSELEGDFFDYALEYSTMRGGFYMVGWKAAPSVYFYNREKAEKYLGSGDPRDVAKYTTSFEGILELARIVNEKSGGQDMLTAGPGHMIYAYMRQFHEPFIHEDGEINTKVLLSSLQFLKQLIDLGTMTYIEGGNPNALVQVHNQGRLFGEVAGPWGLQYYFQYGLPEEVGTFRSTSFVSDLNGYWGLNVSPFSDHIQVAVDSIRSFVTDPQKMHTLLGPTYDFPLSQTVIEMMSDMSSEYLGGQAPIKDWIAAANDLAIGPEYEENSNRVFQFTGPVFQTMVQDRSVTAEQGLKMLVDAITTNMPGTYVK